MQLADGDDAVTSVAQAVMPARNGAIIRVCVVPETDLMDVLSSRERRPRRNANWRGCPTRTEPGTLRSKTVEVRRAHLRMPVAPQRPAAVLIRHNDQQILGSHSAWLPALVPDFNLLTDSQTR